MHHVNTINDTKRQVKSRHCSKQTQRHLFSISTLLLFKKTVSCLLHDNVCLTIVVQDTQSSIKHLLVAYNAYGILHYIPRDISVHPYQVSYFVRTLSNLYIFFK